jgi:hypothetical protein
MDVKYYGPAFCLRRCSRTLPGEKRGVPGDGKKDNGEMIGSYDEMNGYWRKGKE